MSNVIQINKDTNEVTKQNEENHKANLETIAQIDAITKLDKIGPDGVAKVEQLLASMKQIQLF